MQYIDLIEGYKVYRNDDGFLEGYKSTGTQIVNQEKMATNITRVVTNVKTIAEFTKWIKKPVSLKPKPQPLPSLFNDEP